MNDYKILNKLLQWYVDYKGSVPAQPDKSASEAGITIDKQTAYLMCSMMFDDGYLYKPKPQKDQPSHISKGYYANYKAKLFLDEGGYVTQYRIAKKPSSQAKG